jgi:Phosphate transporter family
MRRARSFRNPRRSTRHEMLDALRRGRLLHRREIGGIPVSTTHTITGAIVGVGAARKVAAVRWNVASDVVIAWVLTMPAAAMIGAVFYKLGELLW